MARPIAHLTIVAVAATLAACAGDAPKSSRVESGRIVPDTAAGPATAHAQLIRNTLRDRVVVAGFTSSSEGPRIAEIVYYRPDGIAFVQRLGETALRTFRWDVGAQGTGDGSSYAFISSDGRDDGAAVALAAGGRRLTFSDVDYGPNFAFGVVENCWPGFAPAQPPNVVVCDAATDARIRRQMETEQKSVAADRSRATASSAVGRFTTRPGSVYTTSLGNTITVANVDGRKVSFVNQNGARFASHALLYANNPRVVGNERVAAAIDSLWPLEVGKSAEAWVYNGEWSWKLAWKVTRRERITVPAGTFDAWAIEHTETSLGDGYIGKSESWYAPAAGWNVRFRSWVETQPLAPTSQWVLTRAQVNTREASARP